MRQIALGVFLLSISTALVGAETPPKESGVRAVVQVTAMDLDVVATTGGKPVTDLGRDELTVTVDGKPVVPDFFSRIEEGTLHGLDLATASPDLILETLKNDAGDRYVPRQFLVFFDDEHLLPRERRRLIEGLRDFVTRLTPSDHVAFLSYGSTAPFLVPFTSSKETIFEGLARLEKIAPRGLTWEGQYRQQVNDVRRSPRASTRSSLIRQWSEQVRAREQSTLEELRRAVSALAARSGKRALLYVSRGIELHPGQSLVQALGPTLLNQFDYSVDAELRSVIAEANRAGITIHALDASGIGSDSDASESSPSPFDAFFESQLRKEALSSLADQTGGVLVTNRNEFKPGLDQIYRESSTYYSVGITLTNVDPRKKDLSVKVASTRPGVKIRVRRSYGPKSTAEASRDRMEMALLTPSARGDFDVAFEVGPPKKGGGLGRRLVPFSLRIPVDALTFASDGTTRRATVEVTIAAAEDSGARSGISPSKVPIEIPEGRWDDARKVGFVYNGELKSGKGSLRFVTTVRDVGSDRIAIASQDVRVE
jgi:VWFA-related protein